MNYRCFFFLSFFLLCAMVHSSSGFRKTPPANAIRFSRVFSEIIVEAVIQGSSVLTGPDLVTETKLHSPK